MTGLCVGYRLGHDFLPARTRRQLSVACEEVSVATHFSEHFQLPPAGGSAGLVLSLPQFGQKLRPSTLRQRLLHCARTRPCESEFNSLQVGEVHFYKKPACMPLILPAA